MPHRNWILLLLTIISSSLMAQRHCGADEMTNKLIEADPAFAAEIAEFDEQRGALSQAASNRATVIIPVVVHVIHGGESVGNGTNLSLARIQSQIDILNADFQRMNSDASQTPSAFQGVAANTDIQFGLAIIAPDGSSTSGITRHQYNNVSSTDYIENTIKPATNWDPMRYLNVWTVNIPSGSIIGYSYLPTSTMVGSDRDGLVVTYDKFGYINSTNRGRTATHEIGHYLGLRHVWGRNDQNGDPIGCTSDDDIADTPNQEEPYYGCPNSGASCGSSDMFMNYMDYTDDYCMNLFTQGQANVMNAVLNGIRSELVSNNLTGGSNDGCVSLTSNNYNFGFEPSQSNNEWTVVNDNGDDRSWLFVDQTETDWGPNTGSGCAIYLWNQDAVTSADDYLFSPCMALKANHDYRLSFHMAAAKDENTFYPEKLEVGFSVAKNASDFTVISDNWVFDPVDAVYPNYEYQELFFTTQENLDLSIGFHVFSDPDKYAMMLDDIKVTDLGSVGTKDVPSITKGIKVFPNPTVGRTTLSIDENIWQNEATLTIYNSLGIKVMDKLINPSTQQVELDLMDLVAGVYFCELRDGEKKSIERILKH